MWALIFSKFLARFKKSEKSLYIYSSGEAVHRQTGRQRDNHIDRKWTFYRTTTLHASPINQADFIAAEEVLLTWTLVLFSPPLIFEKIPKRFDKVVWTSYSSSPESRNTGWAID